MRGDVNPSDVLHSQLFLLKPEWTLIITENLVYSYTARDQTAFFTGIPIRSITRVDLLLGLKLPWIRFAFEDGAISFVPLFGNRYQVIPILMKSLVSEGVEFRKLMIKHKNQVVRYGLQKA